jgi:hypothetical protein
VGKHDRLYVRATAEDLARWRQAAAAAGATSLSAFVRDLLDAKPAASAEATVDSESQEGRGQVWLDSEWKRNLALIAAGGQRT